MRAILILAISILSFSLFAEESEVLYTNEKIKVFNKELKTYADSFPVDLKGEKRTELFEKSKKYHDEISKIKSKDFEFLKESGEFYRLLHNTDFEINSFNIANENLNKCIKLYKKKSIPCKFSKSKLLTTKGDLKSSLILLKSINISLIKDIGYKKEVLNQKMLVQMANKKFSGAYVTAGKLYRIEEEQNTDLENIFFKLEKEYNLKEKIKYIPSHENESFDELIKSAQQTDLLATNANNFIGKIVGYSKKDIKLKEKIKNLYKSFSYQYEKIIFIEILYRSGFDNIENLFFHEPFLFKNLVYKNKEKWVKERDLNNLNLESIESFNYLIGLYLVTKEDDIILKLANELNNKKTNNNESIDKQLINNSIKWFLKEKISKEDFDKILLKIPNENIRQNILKVII